MSTTLEPTQTRDESVSSSDSAANRLRSTMAASGSEFHLVWHNQIIDRLQETTAAQFVWSRRRGAFRWKETSRYQASCVQSS